MSTSALTSIASLKERLPDSQITRRPREFRGAAETLFYSRAPEVLVAGPAGTGKSYSCLDKVHACAVAWPGARALMMRKTLQSLTASGLVTYREKVLTPSSDVAFFGGNKEEPASYRYTNGSRLVVGGMDKAEKVMSTDYDLIYVQQAEDLSEADWEALTTRLRNGVMPFQQIIGDCNPSAPTHWLKRRVDAGTLLMLESRHEDNPRLHAGGAWTDEGRVYLARLDALTGVRKDRLRYGRWSAAEGVVYENYDRLTHLVDVVPPARRYVCSVDWGFTNAGVIQTYVIDGDERMCLVEEVYQSQHLIDWWTEQAKRINQRYHPEVFVCDPSEPAYITTFQQAGLPAQPAFNGIRLGIDDVLERLKIAPDGRPRLSFFRDALTERDDVLKDSGKPYTTDQEFDAYVWPKAADGKPLKETPVDADNHGLDCVRYACAYVDRLGNTSSPMAANRFVAGPPRESIAGYRPR